MSSGLGRRRKTLVTKGGAKQAVPQEVAEKRRKAKSGQAARETSAALNRGEHPAEIMTNTRRGAKVAATKDTAAKAGKRQGRTLPTRATRA